MPLTTTEQHLCSLIDARRGALLDDLRRHVALPTGRNNTPALDEARDLFRRRFEALGATTRLIPGDPAPEWLALPGSPPPTLLCTRVAGGAGPRILIAGHLDTVHDPVGPFRELTISPDGANATGPGCVDMKGGLVIAAAALEALDEAGIRAAWSVVLNSDEETGSYHSDRALRDAAREHAFGLALEPALPGGELVTSRPGSGQFIIEARGKAAHVGRDFAAGASAVTALARACLGAAEIADVQRGLLVNVGVVSGGTAPNVVPDYARGLGNVRYFSPELEREAAERLDALATPAGSMPQVTLRRSFNRPAKPLTPGVERLALLARAASEDLGRPLPFASTGGVCDGNNLQAAGLATIDTLGVRGGGLHTPGEWIELSSLTERCKLLAVLINRLSAL